MAEPTSPPPSPSPSPSPDDATEWLPALEALDAPEVPYQYLVMRCVPRADREEFLNVAVVVYSQRLDYLACADLVDPDRLRALAPGLDLDAVSAALQAVAGICRGDAQAGLAEAVDRGRRFGHLAAPRSTVVQPGPVHGGVLAAATRPTGKRDMDAVLQHLLDRSVRAPEPGPEPGPGPASNAGPE